MSTLDDLVALFRTRGQSQYGREAVTQLEHALQAALLAEQTHASPELITAALLHDVGHLLHDLPEDAPEHGTDDHHEKSGHHFLTRHFPPAVTEMVRLHVAAKRYLCAVDNEYHARLSEPSQVSLQLQGGPMSVDEVLEFERNPFYREAVRVRKWDDTAKVPGLQTPPLEHFVSYLEQAFSK